MNIKKMMGVQRLMYGGSTENERAIARGIFERLLLKAGISEEQFNRELEQKDIHFFKYKNRQEKRLLFHIISKVLNNINFDIFGKKGGGKSRGFELSTGQFIEANEMYETYKKAFDKEIETLMSAFILSNDIYAKDSGDRDISKETPEEYSRRQKARAMARTMQKIIIRKRIGNEGTN
jgi:hypothetical protein